MSLHEFKLPSLKDKLQDISQKKIEKSQEEQEEKVVSKARKGRRLNK